MASHPLVTFYKSVAERSFTLATLISEDIITIALYGSSTQKESAQEAVRHLRARMADQPEPLRQELEDALRGLGYS